jgi:hypothetical protein
MKLTDNEDPQERRAEPGQRDRSDCDCQQKPRQRNRHLDLCLEQRPRKEGRKMTVVLLSFLLTITVRTWGIAK